MFMWQIVYTKNENKIILDQEFVKFNSCRRFFTNENYKKFSKLPIDEVVSIDVALFPCVERIFLDEKNAKTQAIANDVQILRVCYIASEVASVAETIDGFDFCGYDLIDRFEISALTNCGGFDNAFTHKDLNAFGLIPNYQSARKIQLDLESKYPDEEHADCLLFAIWRRIE